jgi:beta-glucosidase
MSSFVRRFAPAFGALALGFACSHRQAPPGGTTVNAGGSSNPSGGSSNPSGGSSNPSGGSSNPSGGVGGGSGGSEVVIGGSGGTGGQIEKMSCGDGTYSDKYTPGYTDPPNPQVQTLVNTMTLEQKFTQMRGTAPGTESSKNYDDIQRSPDDPANNIRGYMYRDGPRGVNLDARQQGRPYVSNHSTAFPVTMARGASFDLELEYRVGEAQGDETVASQNTMMLGPCMNILRHPAWGRAQETYGEDSYHLGRIASAYTVGVQQFVAACAKHYAGNNIENGRENLNAQMDEQTLREVYGRHFEMVVRDGGVACIMAAYNSVNGTKSTQNRHLLTEILRDDFKFRGLVLSDWWAMPPGQNFPSASTAQDNAANAVQAGLDLELPWNLNFAQLGAVVPSRIPEALINQAVSRILEQKFRFNSALLNGQLGLKQPSTTMTNGSITNNDHHIDLARETAVKSMVLLKNDNNTLPIKTDGSIDKVAVIGANVSYTLQNTTPMSGTINFAVDQPLGDRGSSRVNADPAKTTGPTAGLTAVGASHGITVVSGNSASAVGDADFVVVMVGLTPQHESEEYASPNGGDRQNFSLPGNQNQLVSDVAALGKPMVVVIEAGSMIDMPWLSQVPAVVMAWYPGQRGGQALAQLLLGEANFSGKLPFTWATGWDQLPTFNQGTTTSMSYYLGYRYFDQNNLTPLYPYGHGLSYSTFSYSNLQVACSDVTKNGVINVHVDIANTSPVAGEEVAFLFVSYPSTSARRSKKELKGFYKVQLDGNQAKRITIPLRVADLKYWDMNSNSWVVESGPVQIMVGPSSADLPLTDTVQVL